jgi:hypothetical protein
MSTKELAELWSFLDDRPVWPNHVATKAPGYPEHSKPLREFRTDSEWPMASPTMETAVCAPHLLEYALRAYPIALDYFGEPPLLYSLNMFFSQPAASTYPETHVWHRDGDDRKQLGVFMFGTDVLTHEDGAHLFQRGTHRLRDGSLPSGDTNTVHAQLDAELGNAYQFPRAEDVEVILGPAGTMFLEDPSGVHRGVRPRALRMFAWARWGVSDPPVSYSQWDHLSPVPRELIASRYPENLVLREAIRLVVS